MTPRRAGWVGVLLGLAACSSGDADGDTDTDTDLATGAVDSGDTGVDTDDTDPALDSDTDGAASGTGVLTDGWTDGGAEAISVDRGANAGRGEVTITVESTTDVRFAAMYFGGVSKQPREQESHTLTGKASSVDGVAAWTRTLDCDASSTVANSKTVFRCDGADDEFTEGEVDHNVAVAVGVWRDPSTDGLPPSATPDDCVLFGRYPDLLVDDPPPAGLTPPSWVGDRCRTVQRDTD